MRGQLLAASVGAIAGAVGLVLALAALGKVHLTFTHESRAPLVIVGTIIGVLAALILWSGRRATAIEARRRLTQQSLEESERRYKDLFRKSPIPMWTYDLRSLLFLDVNDAAVRQYGYSRDEFLGMTIKDIRPPEDVPALLDEIARLPSSAAVEDRLWRHARKDGSLLDVQVMAQNVEGKAGPVRQVIALDVTERLRAQQSLAESEERYRRVFEADLAGAMVTDPEGRLLDCNPAALGMLGLRSIEEYADRRAPSLYEDPARRDEILARLAEQDRTEQFELELRRVDGAPLHVLARVLGIKDASGRLVELRTFFFDITDKKRVEAQLRQAQKMDAIGRLAGGVAHDFNNLLGVITGYGDLLARQMGAQDPGQRRLSEIRKAADRAAALTRRLLTFSRQQDLEPRVLDLNALVADVERMLQRLISEDIEVVTRLAPGLGQVSADPGSLEQAIVNLAVNARDAMPRGGRLVLETAEQELDAQYCASHPGVSPGVYVMLAVSDTGHGMDEQTLGRIFEPFFTTKEAGKGTGLGLATVYGIVQQSGGSISVYSEVGLGTSFKVFLPRVATTAPEAVVEAPVAPLTRGSGTILLVEDSGALRELMHETLEEAGYTVIEASGAEGAGEAVAANAGAIDLLVTDVVMPTLSGPELAALLRASNPRSRVLFVSGYTEEMIGERGVRESGPFLQKPFTSAGLLKAVSEALQS